MFDSLLNNPMGFLRDTVLFLPGIVIAFSFHEFAHAWVAYLLGDDTARSRGRLTLSPIAHVDPIGLLMLIFLRFGWAKPVPVNPLNFTHKVSMRHGMLLTALAGPMMNLLLALITAVVLRLSRVFLYYQEWGEIVLILLINLMTINVTLMVFNLVPVPPLDGSKVLAGLLPRSAEPIFDFIERYGMIILLVLVFSGVISRFILPLSSSIVLHLYDFIYPTY
jgi:Zn-dependent protease